MNRLLERAYNKLKVIKGAHQLCKYEVRCICDNMLVTCLRNPMNNHAVQFHL